MMAPRCAYQSDTCRVDPRQQHHARAPRRHRRRPCTAVTESAQAVRLHQIRGRLAARLAARRRPHDCAKHARVVHGCTHSRARAYTCLPLWRVPRRCCRHRRRHPHHHRRRRRCRPHRAAQPRCTAHKTHSPAAARKYQARYTRSPRPTSRARAPARAIPQTCMPHWRTAA